MVVVNPNNTSHTSNIIPREYPTGAITIDLYSEYTKVSTSVVATYTTYGGILTIAFDFTFSENDQYQVKILEGAYIIFRGKLIATAQNTQSYNLTNDKYSYYE